MTSPLGGIGVKLDNQPLLSVIPAKAGTHSFGEKLAYILPRTWFPAFAGMTNSFLLNTYGPSPG